MLRTLSVVSSANTLPLEIVTLVDTNQRYGRTAVAEQTRPLKANDNAKNRQQLPTLMKGCRLDRTVDVEYGRLWGRRSLQFPARFCPCLKPVLKRLRQSRA